MQLSSIPFFFKLFLQHVLSKMKRLCPSKWNGTQKDLYSASRASRRYPFATIYDVGNGPWQLVQCTVYIDDSFSVLFSGDLEVPPKDFQGRLRDAIFSVPFPWRGASTQHCLEFVQKEWEVNLPNQPHIISAFFLYCVLLIHGLACCARPAAVVHQPQCTAY